MKQIFYFLLFTPFFFACSSTRQNIRIADASLKNHITATWKGTIPCADCEGITFQLQLMEDGNFIDRSVYLGKENNEFTSKGKWSVATDSIVATVADNGTKSYYLFSNNSLQLLDADKKAIQSEFPELFILNKISVGENPSVINERIMRGVDFEASGNEPFWGLEIDFGKSMTFTNADGFKLVTTVPKGIRAADVNVIRYSAESEMGSMIVQLIKQSCTNSMSAVVSDYQVKVNINNAAGNEPKEYTGCGKLIGNYRLNGF